MQNKALQFFFLCFAFILTPESRAESVFYKKAQDFFSQSQTAVKKYLISGKGLDEPKENQDLSSAQITNSESSSVQFENSNFSTPQPNVNLKALYFSLISQSIRDSNDDNPTFGLSLAVSIPVYSSFSALSSEFQISGDIKNAGDWGQVQFLQKESFSLFRFQDLKIELFFGLGIGYGHGSKIVSEDRYFAPWATGLQWGKLYSSNKVFYRFEIGWAGDFYFADSKYNQGLLANLSLGYKL